MREDVYTYTEHDAGRYERARSEDDYYEHASHGRTAQHTPTAPLCPECAQGKPQNCAGQALDANDDLVTCSGGGSR